MSVTKNRDRIWDRILELIESGEPFSIIDVREGMDTASLDPGNIRDTLKSMEDLGWVKQADDGDLWEPDRAVVTMPSPGLHPPFLHKLSRRNVRHPAEFDGIPLETCLNNLSEEDVIDVAFLRYSSGTGHLIAYPIMCEFENTEDGIHVDPPEPVDDHIRQHIKSDDTLVAGRVHIDEILTQYPRASIVDIISGEFLTDDKLRFMIGSAASNLSIEESGIVRDAFSFHFTGVETVSDRTERKRTYQERRRDILKTINRSWR